MYGAVIAIFRSVGVLNRPQCAGFFTGGFAVACIVLGVFRANQPSGVRARVDRLAQNDHEAHPRAEDDALFARVLSPLASQVGGRLTGFVGAGWFHEEGYQRTPAQFAERLALAQLAGLLDGSPTTVGDRTLPLAAYPTVARGALADSDRQALAALITKLGPLPAIADLSIAEVLEAVRRDKKVVNGRLHFVIAIAIGSTITVDDVTEDELRAVLHRLGMMA